MDPNAPREGSERGFDPRAWLESRTMARWKWRIGSSGQKAIVVVDSSVSHVDAEFANKSIIGARWAPCQIFYDVLSAYKSSERT